MLLLDTCAVSEVMHENRDPGFQEWFSATRHDALAIPTVAITELLYGIRRLPEGKRKSRLMQQLTGYIDSFHILGFCRDASEHASIIMAQLHGTGDNIKFPDAAIASIALHNNAVLVTRDAHFIGIAGHKGCENFQLMNPWKRMP